MSLFWEIAGKLENSFLIERGDLLTHFCAMMLEFLYVKSISIKCIHSSHSISNLLLIFSNSNEHCKYYENCENSENEQL